MSRCSVRPPETLMLRFKPSIHVTGMAVPLMNCNVPSDTTSPFETSSPAVGLKVSELGSTVPAVGVPHARVDVPTPLHTIVPEPQAGRGAGELARDRDWNRGSGGCKSRRDGSGQ